MTAFGAELVKLKQTGKLLRKSQIRRLWHLGYYDGPLSGICMVGDQICYFGLHFEPDWGRRIFVCYPLTTEEFKEELYHHELFRIYVGFHTDYHLPGSSGCRQLGYLHTGWEKDWSKIADKKRAPVNYSDREPIAYFR